jgi:hypothetical protein
LIYHGSESNRWIKIVAKVNNDLPNSTGSDTTSTIFSGVVKLPMQEVVMDMAPIPQHIDWWNDGSNPPPVSTKPGKAKLVIKDGQGTYLRNVPVTFYSTMGEFNPSVYPDFGYDQVTEIDDFDDIPETGMTDQFGYLYKTVVFKRYECPAPDPMTGAPGQTNATCTAHIVGYDKQISVDFILRRYLQTGK